MTTGPDEITPTPASPLRAAARYWIVMLLLAAIGTAAGVYYGNSKEDVTTAESRVIVGTGTIRDYAIPGFPTAAEALAQNYARLVGQQIFAPTLQSALGSRYSQVRSVAGSPVPQSFVIRIEVGADGASVARTGADTVARGLVAQVRSLNGAQDPAVALKTFSDLASQVAQASANQTAISAAYDHAVALQTRGGQVSVDDPLAGKNIDRAVANGQKSLVAIRARVAVLTAQRDAAKNIYADLRSNPSAQSQLTIISKAAVTGSTRRPAIERYGLAGLAAGLVLGLAFSTLLDRRSRRRDARRSGSTAAREAGLRDPTSTPGAVGSQLS